MIIKFLKNPNAQCIKQTYEDLTYIYMKIYF